MSRHSVQAAAKRGEPIEPPNRTIDWPAVERDYRAGLLSLRALGEKHACAHSTIANFAARHGWLRDGCLATDVVAAADKRGPGNEIVAQISTIVPNNATPREGIAANDIHGHQPHTSNI